MSKVLDKLDSIAGNSLMKEEVSAVGLPPKNKGSRKRIFFLGALVLIGAFGILYLYQKRQQKQLTELNAQELARRQELERFYQEGLNALHAKNFDLAIEQFSKIVAAVPDKPGPQVNLAVALRKKGEIDKAEKILLKVIEQDPKEAIAHNNLGLVYLDKQDFEKAIASFNESIVLLPTYTDPVLNLAYLSELKKNRRDAVKYYERYLGSPDDKRGYRGLISERVRRLYSYARAEEGKN